MNFIMIWYELESDLKST